MAFDLAQAIAAAAPGATVRVPEGTHAVNLVIDKSITLMGAGAATTILDGQRQGCVVRIVAPEAVVRLSGLMILGGQADDAGGGVCAQEGTVDLLQCTLRFNKAPLLGGGALYVGGQKATVSQCRFEGNTGRQGGAILVDQAASLVLRDSMVIQNAAVLGGGLRVRDGGSADVLGCTIADNKVVGDDAEGAALHLSGSTTRTPRVTVSHCVISERAQGPVLIFNGAQHPGTLAFQRCLLPDWSRAVGGDNLFGPAAFVGSGTEPYQLSAASPAVGVGDPAAFGGDKAKDVTGRPRGTKPHLGAIASAR